MSEMVSISDLVQASLDLGELDAEEWQRKWARRLIGGAKAAAEGNIRRDTAIQHLLKATSAGQVLATEVAASLQSATTKGLTFEQIAAVFGVMAACQKHTFLVLTKRAERTVEWFRWIRDRQERIRPGGSPAGITADLVADAGRGVGWPFSGEWPLPNVHLGVSCENQAAADERIPLLLQCPAAVHWISAEPLLGPLDLAPWMHDSNCDRDPCICCEPREVHLDWVVVGGESGPGARPCELGGIRSIRDQCRAAAVPCFVKQLGARPVCECGESLREDHYDGFHGERGLTDSKGGDMSEWPEGLRVREFPS